MSRIQKILYGYVPVVVTLALAVSIYGSYQRADDAEQFAMDLRTALAESCKVNANPLRTVQRQDIRDHVEDAREEIAQDQRYLRHPEQLQAIFPGSDPEQLGALIRRGIAEERSQIAEGLEQLKAIPIIDCEAVLPG